MRYSLFHLSEGCPYGRSLMRSECAGWWSCRCARTGCRSPGRPGGGRSRRRSCAAGWSSSPGPGGPAGRQVTADSREQESRGHLEERGHALDGYIKGWNRLANAKIEDRLSRLWAKKQVPSSPYNISLTDKAEKDEKFMRLRAQHEKELRLLASRSKKKVNTGKFHLMCPG